MTYPTHLLPTTVVGSYPQPDWLVNRAALEKHGVPRTHAQDIWRIPAELLEQAQDDGTILAIRDMERAGIDIITDGEIRRESYSNRFALALEGIDAEHPGEVRSQAGRATPVPRVVGKIRRRGAGRAARRRVPAAADRSRDEDHAARSVHAVAAGEERILRGRGRDGDGLRRRRQRGAARPEGERRRRGAARRALGAHRARQGGALRRARDQPRAGGNRRADRGASVLRLRARRANKPSGYAFLPQLADTIAQQISIEAAQPKIDLGVLADLSGKQIMLGVLDLGSAEVETAEQVADRIRAGLRHVAAERLIPAPDCGMKYMPRERAFGKLRALVDGAAIVRRELAG